MVTRPTPLSCSAAYTGGEPIAETRDLARSFLTGLRDVHGLPVGERAADVVELVVSELVTNTRKYAPGATRLSLQVRDGRIEVAVWDSNPNPPTILPPGPLRIGQRGLAIVMAVARTFAVQREPAGKRITALITLGSVPAGPPAPGAGPLVPGAGAPVPGAEAASYPAAR